MIMPNMPSRGTPKHTIRCSSELWDAARAVAEERGEDLSSVIRKALEQYVARQERRRQRQQDR